MYFFIRSHLQYLRFPTNIVLLSSVGSLTLLLLILKLLPFSIEPFRAIALSVISGVSKTTKAINDPAILRIACLKIGRPAAVRKRIDVIFPQFSKKRANCFLLVLTGKFPTNTVLSLALSDSVII